MGKKTDDLKKALSERLEAIRDYSDTHKDDEGQKYVQENLRNTLMSTKEHYYTQYENEVNSSYLHKSIARHLLSSSKESQDVCMHLERVAKGMKSIPKRNPQDIYSPVFNNDINHIIDTFQQYIKECKKPTRFLKVLETIANDIVHYHPDINSDKVAIREGIESRPEIDNFPLDLVSFIHGNVVDSNGCEALNEKYTQSENYNRSTIFLDNTGYYLGHHNPDSLIIPPETSSEIRDKNAEHNFLYGDDSPSL